MVKTLTIVFMVTLCYCSFGHAFDGSWPEMYNFYGSSPSDSYYFDTPNLRDGGSRFEINRWWREEEERAERLQREIERNQAELRRRFQRESCYSFCSSLPVSQSVQCMNMCDIH